MPQPLHELGLQRRRHAVLQLVRLDVGFMELHAQEPHHQPLGETVPTGNAFALFRAPVGEADPACRCRCPQVPAFPMRRSIPATDGTEVPSPSVGGSWRNASVSRVSVGVSESSHIL